MTRPPEDEDQESKEEARERLLSRVPQSSALEDMVASELAMAVLSRDPLEKIRHILEAFQLIDEKAPILTAAGITEEQVRVLYLNCLGLSQIHIQQGIAQIAWPFPTTEASRMLNWIKIVFFELLREEDRDEFMARVNAGDEKLWAWYLQQCYRYSQYCHPSFAYELRSHFISQVMPVALKIMRAIVEHYVHHRPGSSPSVS